MHAGQVTGADEIKSVEPKVRSALNRFPEPGDRVSISSRKEERAADDPVKHADRRVVRAEPDRLLDQRLRFRRATDEDQLIALIGISGGKVPVELDRAAECLQRSVMFAAGPLYKPVYHMRQRVSRIDQ